VKQANWLSRCQFANNFGRALVLPGLPSGPAFSASCWRSALSSPVGLDDCASLRDPRNPRRNGLFVTVRHPPRRCRALVRGLARLVLEEVWRLLANAARRLLHQVTKDDWVSASCRKLLVVTSLSTEVHGPI